jgi:hypothetical protein
MALVPFRTLGPAADQSAPERLFLIAGRSILIKQYPAAGNQALSQNMFISSVDECENVERAGVEIEALEDSGRKGPSPTHHLGSVGFVAWQCGFLLAEWLLRFPPCAWYGIQILDLASMRRQKRSFIILSIANLMISCACM